MCEGWPHHQGLRPLLFSNSEVGIFTSHKNQISVSAVTRFFVLIRKDLQMSLQRQHFLFSYLGPWVLVWLGIEPATSHSAADWCSPNWANQVEGELAFILVGLLIVQSSPQSLHNNCFNGEWLGRHKWQFSSFSVFFSVLAPKVTWLRMQDFNELASRLRLPCNLVPWSHWG